MIGRPSSISDTTRAPLVSAAGNLPQIPRLTGLVDGTGRVWALTPAAITDDGNARGPYAGFAMR